MKTQVKKYVKNAMLYSIGAGVVGSVAGSTGAPATVRNNIAAGFDIGSVYFPIKGASMAVNSFHSTRLLNKRRHMKRKGKY